MGYHEVQTITTFILLKYTCRFKQVPRNYWKNRSNQLAELKELEQKLKIKEPSDWYQVSSKNIVDNGGISLLKQFGESISKMLASLYPDVTWDVRR
jgi:hypothetical protein